MALTASPDLVAALRQLPLLDAAQLDEVAVTLQLRFPDARSLAAELRQRGWVSAFQAERLLQGRGADLLLGPYLLLDRLGQGGMGEVFKARHQLMNRVVALKVIRKDLLADPTSQLRFIREIQAAAQLSHPNIVMAHDAAQVGDSHFFAMEYVEGTDLNRLVERQGRLPVATACEYIRQVALGLQHAHERGLVHRDIKPSNLLLSFRGAEKGNVKILDMGLARFARDSVHTALTETGAVIGTPDYLAPEQVINSRTVDIRADLYSLGCTFYFLLTGGPPFAEGTAIEKLFKHTEDYPRPVEDLRPEVPPQVAIVVRKLMAKHPDDRYQKPAHVAALLEPFCEQPEPEPGAGPSLVAAPPRPESSATLTGRSGRFLAQRPWSALLIVVLALLAGIGAGLAFWYPWQDRSGRSLPPRLTNSLGMEMVLIPAGTPFTMGSPSEEKGRHADEGPLHEVVISRPFYLGAHEVTVADFREFVRARNYRTEAEKDGKGSLRWDGAWEWDTELDWQKPGWEPSDSEPVVCVSRADALAFCEWLGQQESKTYRLPTEAEWEYACRAGTTTPFHGGPTLSSQQANFDGNFPYGKARGPALYRKKTSPVGSFPASPWGLFDMHGNVWEWCADAYDGRYYSSSPRLDPQGPAKSKEGVVRGGSWCSEGESCRSARRLRMPLSYRRNDLGFRVVLTPEGRPH